MIRSFSLAILLACTVPAHAGDDAGALAFWRQSQGQPQKKHPRWRSDIPLPPNVGHLRALIAAASARHHVSASLISAVIHVESGGNCHARNRSGATGVMQLMPATARGVGVRGRLTDCATGIEAGTRYLARIIHRHGSGCAALSLYEAGEFARPRCSSYARRVLRFAGAGR